MTHESRDPLEALLTILATEQAMTLQGVAERLGVAPALIEQMLETLCTAGYLRPRRRLRRPLRPLRPGRRGRGRLRLYSGSRIWTVTPAACRRSRERVDGLPEGCEGPPTAGLHAHRLRCVRGGGPSLRLDGRAGRARGESLTSA